MIPSPISSSATLPYQGRTLTDRNPAAIDRLMPVWGWLYRHYFRVQTSGWEHIPSQGNALFVGSHNGGLASPDLFMFAYDWYRRFGYAHPVYGLTHPKVWQVFPDLAQMAAQIGSVRAEPKIAIAALNQGASVLVYPGGAQDTFRPHSQRHKIHFAGRVGYIKLALRQAVPIVPLISWGAHDTLIVLGDCYEQVKALHRAGMPWLFSTDPEVFPIYLGLPWGLALGALPNWPLPAQIHTRVCPPITFERTGRAAARDQAYVADCAIRVERHMQQALDQLIHDVEQAQS